MNLSRDDIKTMLVAGLIALAIVIGAAAMAHADEPKLPPGITCADVRTKVAEYGETVAYAWARLQGYSRAQIKEARKCLR